VKLLDSGIVGSFLIELLEVEAFGKTKLVIRTSAIGSSDCSR
jgi:hypothetical protein